MSSCGLSVDNICLNRNYLMALSKIAFDMRMAIGQAPDHFDAEHSARVSAWESVDATATGAVEKYTRLMHARGTSA